MRRLKCVSEIQIHVISYRENVVVFFCCFFLNSALHPFQDYFSSYEMGQSVGGAKTREPREKTPDTPASRTWLVSHVARAGLEPTPVTAVIEKMCHLYTHIVYGIHSCGKQKHISGKLLSAAIYILDAKTLGILCSSYSWLTGFSTIL